MPRIVLASFNLAEAERVLVAEALAHAGSIVEAAQLLGITRRVVARAIIRHKIAWPRPALAEAS